jgi:hypothetical protein
MLLLVLLLLLYCRLTCLHNEALLAEQVNVFPYHGVHCCHRRGMEGCQELLKDSHVRRFLQVAGLRAGSEPQRESSDGQQVRGCRLDQGKAWRRTRSLNARDP